MQTLSKILYRTFWWLQQVKYANGKLYWHIYHQPTGRYIGKEKTAARCKHFIDELLAEPEQAKELIENGKAIEGER